MTGIDLGHASGYLIFALVFAAYFMALEAIFMSFARRSSSRSAVAKRISADNHAGNDQREALVKQRQTRSLSPDGDYILPTIWLNRLILQSGVKLGVAGFPLIVVVASALLVLVLLIGTGSVVLALPIGLAAGAGLPVLALMLIRRRRLTKFEAHLPETIDTLVRSLRAGHPVQAAIRMIVREMPQPIGTEFAIVSDELTYGLDLETAMKGLHRRVGQQDLGLLVAAIGLQSKTGGNLAEILGNLSAVIRDRLRMRLKVQALSAEARFSAIVLSILPFLIFAILAGISPTYYGDVWDVAIVKPMLVLAALWMLIGNVVMYRMVRFEV
jgi:tight adherence protein B